MNRKNPSVLFCGESPGGSANYMIGLLNAARAGFTHVASSEKLSASAAGRAWDAIIISDYPAKNIGSAAARALERRLREGAGLLMVGGWGSFAGPFGGWEDSFLAPHLPVRCRARDDRRNIQQGAYVFKRAEHALTRGLPWDRPPVICGLNQFQAKAGAITLATARPIEARSGAVRLTGEELPLLVVDERGGLRRAALATDVAPHWCGGLVDWGSKRVFLRVGRSGRSEVGADYARFGARLIRWTAGL